jgi:hypothetical protein
MHRLSLCPALFALLMLVEVSALAQVVPAPALLNFQGRLAKPDGTPVSDGTYSVKFSLFPSATSLTQKWTETDTVTVHNGVFAVLLGKTTAISDALFAGSLWLEIKVGTDPALTPRQPLVSVAYALKADTVPDTSIGSAQLKDGAVTAGKLASGALTPGLLNPLVWLLGGNSGTNPASQFLGTTDNQALVLKVNNHRSVQYQYAENTLDQYRSVNVLGGSEINSIAAGVVGATISGGGQDFFSGTDFPNMVTANFGTIGGGYGNTVSGYAATVGGGYGNTIIGPTATVEGGVDNSASGQSATVGGGVENVASGITSTVAGGISNTAAGNYSFAAGNQAQALHDGSFVWADSQNAPFPSTDINQFLIRAAGGVGINTNTPAGYTLYVNAYGSAYGLLAISTAGYGVSGLGGNIGVYAHNLVNGNDVYLSTQGLAGDFYGNVFVHGNLTYTGSLSQASDARYKTHVTTFPNALETILNLRGVGFEWNREAFPRQNFPSGRQIGFIAQEVEQVLPELVHTDAGGYKSVAYQNLVPVLVEAIKQQETQIRSQQAQIETLQAENAAFKERQGRMDALETQLRALAETVRQLQAGQNR